MKFILTVIILILGFGCFYVNGETIGEKIANRINSEAKEQKVVNDIIRARGRLIKVIKVYQLPNGELKTITIKGGG